MTAVAAGDEPIRKRGRASAGGGTTPPPPQQQQQPPPPAPSAAEQGGLRCPRCDSSNTKFCYYNNYSLSQPRHFCKACRRYWTKGGALRNVPVGGACRRKHKRSRSAASRLSLNPVVSAAAVDQQSSAATLGFLGGGAPAAHYQRDMMVGQNVPFVEWPPPPPGPAPPAAIASSSSGIASSIESLSFINQDLHWKLQQQRLATMFLATLASDTAPAHLAGGAAFLQMAAAGAPAMEPTVPAVTSWMTMDSSSYVLPSPPPPATATATTATNSNINSGRSSRGDDNNCGSGIPVWGDMSTFTRLPP